MAYRNGTYTAFDGNSEDNPTKSDQRYLQLLKAWNENSDIEFSFSDSHSKTYQVKADSENATLKNRLKERMANSKNFLLIISEDTNYDRGLLNYEIELAVETYHLPIIIAYTKYGRILYPRSHQKEWPKKLDEYILNGKARCVHVPFKKAPILFSIKKYKVDDLYPDSSLGHFDEDTYKKWEGIS